LGLSYQNLANSGVSHALDGVVGKEMSCETTKIITPVATSSSARSGKYLRDEDGVYLQDHVCGQGDYTVIMQQKGHGKAVALRSKEGYFEIRANYRMTSR
jgi:hypothetical protein